MAFNSESMDRAYYSKLQDRFITRGEYFDELLFGTLEAPFDQPISKKIQTKNDNIINK